LVRSDVIVLDPFGDEAPADRTRGLVAVGWQPLAIGLHLGVGVDGRKRRGNPAGFKRVGGISARAHRHDAELSAGLKNRGTHLLAFLIRAPDFKARRAGHAMAQAAYLAAADIDF